MKKYIMFCLIFLTSCVEYYPTRLLYVHNGAPIYETRCDGYNNTIGDCMIEMARQCPTGYNIIKSSEEQVGSVVNVATQQSYNNNYNPMLTATSPYYANMFGLNNGYQNSNANTQAVQTYSMKRYTIFSCKR